MFSYSITQVCVCASMSLGSSPPNVRNFGRTSIGFSVLLELEGLVESEKNGFSGFLSKTLVFFLMFVIHLQVSPWILCIYIYIYIQNLFDSYLQYLSKYIHIHWKQQNIYIYIYIVYYILMWCQTLHPIMRIWKRLEANSLYATKCS